MTRYLFAIHLGSRICTQNGILSCTNRKSTNCDLRGPSVIDFKSYRFCWVIKRESESLRLSVRDGLDMNDRLNPPI